MAGVLLACGAALFDCGRSSVFVYVCCLFFFTLLLQLVLWAAQALVLAPLLVCLRHTMSFLIALMALAAVVRGVASCAATVSSLLIECTVRPAWYACNGHVPPLQLGCACMYSSLLQKLA